MTEAGATPRRQWLYRFVLVFVIAAVLLGCVVTWYVTTDNFQAMVRQQVVSNIERISGGRVEFGSIHSVPFRFQVEIRDLTIHGSEANNEIPYAHVDRIVAHLKLLSAIGIKLGFRSLALDHPVVHLVFYPDGSSNQPRPTLHRPENSVQKLFSLSIDSLEVRRGELLWNDQKIPLDFEAKDVSADLTYSHLHGRYEGEFLAAKIDSQLKNLRPLAWMAEAHFSLGRNTLDVKSLKVSSGRSRIEAAGRMVNFSKPHVDGTYTASIDLAEAEAIARRIGVRRGILDADGTGSWSAAGFSSQGTVMLQNFDWRDARLNVRNVAGSTQFSLDGQRIVFSQIQGTLLGGAIAGDGDIANWRNILVAGQSPPSSQQQSSFRLRLSGMSVAELANVISSTARPLNRLRIAGTVAGTVHTTWRGSPQDAQSEFDLAVTAPRQVLPAELPVEGHASGLYRFSADELQLRELHASTRASQLTAAGTFSSTAKVRFSVSTTDLSEWERVFAASGYNELAASTLRGQASFNGQATGKFSAIAFAGDLRSQNGSCQLLPTSNRSRREVRWDSLSTSLEVSPQGIAAHNGIVHRGHTLASFDFSADLQQRKFSGDSPFTGRLDVRNGEASNLLSLAGYELPVKGGVNLSVQTRGTRHKPEGQAQLELMDATVYGHSVRQLQTRLSFLGDQISISALRALEDGAELSGTGAYNTSTRAYLLDLHGNNFRLSRFTQLQYARLPIDARMDFAAQGEGTLEAPVINGTLRLRDVTFQHERAGNFTLQAQTRGTELHLTGQSEFKAADLELDGDVHLRGNWPSAINLHLNHLDVDPLLRVYLRDHVTGPSALAGDIRVEGPLKDLSDLRITSSLSDMYLDLEHVQFRNNGPVNLAVAHETLTIQQLRLIGQDTDLMLSGSLQLAGEHDLALRANGNAGLQLLHSFNPELTSSGTVGTDVLISGTVSKPRLQGHLQVSNAALSYADLPGSLTSINGSLVFTEDRLKIETLTARLGGGTLDLQGYSNLRDHQLNFNLALRAHDVRLRYPQGISSITTADLKFAGTTAASLLSGDITVNKLAVTPGFDFGAYLQRSSQSSVLSGTDPLLNRIRLDVHITTAPQLQMQTAVVRLSGEADMRLRGTAAKPVLLGRADILEGQIYVNGAKYRMERGDISFSNPVTTTAILDLQATTRVRDYDITVNLNGSLDKLNLSYHSEPPLSTADIINLLALGQTQLPSAQLQQTAQTPFTQEASSAILAEALNTAVSNRSQRLFGMSHIKIDPQGLNTETAPTQTTPAVTIEQQVRDNLTLTYTTNVSQTSQQIIQGEYNITRDLSILGIRDYNGVISFEVQLRRRRR